MATYDFAVIGAGVFGSWIARTLAQRGQRVVLVDQYGPANSRASSGGETRILRMGYGSREIYTRWSLRSQEIYRAFYDAVEPGLLLPTGFLWMARGQDEFLDASAAVFARLGVRHEHLTRAELERRYPQIAFGPITHALYEPDAGALLARRGVQAVVRETVAAGLEYRQAAMDAAPAGIDAGTWLYCCGPWLRRLFPELLGQKIHPTRQEVFYFGTGAGDVDFRMPAMPAWIDPGSTVYGLPDIETRGFKIAIDRHGPLVDPDTEERLVPEASVAAVRAYLAERFPRLAQAPLTLTEVCQYENTGNGDYIIDRHPERPDVWIVGGGSGHGYKHGPALGEYVAAALLDGARIDPRFSLAAKPLMAESQRTSTIPSQD